MTDMSRAMAGKKKAETSHDANGAGWWALPAQMADAMLQLSRVPQSLIQPILPGWSFGNVISVTEQNSSAPDTERRIVAKVSYGKQIGRMMDAIEALIAKLPAEARKAEAFKDLADLKSEIDAVKLSAAKTRIDQFKADLKLLKASDAASYKKVARDLKTVLGE